MALYSSGVLLTAEMKKIPKLLPETLMVNCFEVAQNGSTDLRSQNLFSHSYIPITLAFALKDEFFDFI